jgi:Leucine-rich repeat (LRR) protein
MLSLSDNRINNSLSFWEAIPKSISELYLMKSGFSKIPSGVFKLFPNLVLLVLDENKLKSFVARGLGLGNSLQELGFDR